MLKLTFLPKKNKLDSSFWLIMLLCWFQVHKGQTSKDGVKYSNGTDKYDVIQKCSARGRCENGTGGFYYVEDARKLQLYNLSFSDSTEFW